MSLFPVLSALIGTVVIVLLLVEFYQVPLLAVAGVAVAFWLVLMGIIALYDEWRR